MNPKNFFAELKRRNVYKVAVAYAVVAWLLIQASSILFPTFEAPAWVMKVFVTVVAAGFPIALVLAWAFELTPEGIKRTDDAVPAGAPVQRGRGKLFWSLVAIAAIAAALLTLHFFRSPRDQISAGDRGGKAAAKKSLAVLPFENLSEDKANAYFADGMQDEIITRLAKIGELKVISRSSTQRYRSKGENVAEIARQLGVAHLVEGSVQKVGDRVRINVQLIEPQKDEHLWAELYDRNLTDIFAVQSEVATAIARSLQAKLSGREQKAVTEKPTSNLDAYDAYLRGLDFFNRPGMSLQNMRAAADSFSEAVRLDPNFALAWCRLSATNGTLYFNQLDATPARMEAARVALENATKLSPDAPDTLMADAYYRYRAHRDYEGARVRFEKVRKQVPSNSDAPLALAFIARRQSRWNDALRLFDEVARLNPRDVQLLNEWSWTLSMIRENAAALQIVDRGLTVLPDDPALLAIKALLYQTQGDLPSAASVLEKLGPTPSDEGAIFASVNQFLLERRHRDAIDFLQKILSGPVSKSSLTASFCRVSLGFAQELAGDKTAARRTYLEALDQFETLQRAQPANATIVAFLSAVHAGLGNMEAALREGERSLAMLPATKDPVDGPVMEELFARTEARLGEVDRALGRLERLLTTPYGAYAITQAVLRLDPAFDPLRSHPRFQKLVSGPEPKTVYQ